MCVCVCVYPLSTMHLQAVRDIDLKPLQVGAGGSDRCSRGVGDPGGGPPTAPGVKKGGGHCTKYPN